MVNRLKNILISGAEDDSCRLWSIDDQSCRKIFKGHSFTVYSLMVLSDKEFFSCANEIIFWNIENESPLKRIEVDPKDKNIFSMCRKGGEILFCGEHDFIGRIEI